MDLQGTVSKKVLSAGSKSERSAVVLTTDDGTEFVLRMRGGHPMLDPNLESLVGNQVRLQGNSHRNIFFIDAWTIEE